MKFPFIGRGENDEGPREPADESKEPVESGAHGDVPAAQPAPPVADAVSEPEDGAIADEPAVDAEPAPKESEANQVTPAVDEGVPAPAPDTAEAAVTNASAVQPAPEQTAPLPLAGTVLADRYVVVGPLAQEAAADLVGVATREDGDLWAVEDRRGFEHCWSCGSTQNGESQRFCIDCGAPLQHRQTVLARTTQPSSEEGEFQGQGAWFHPVRPRKQFDSAGISIEIGGYSAEGPHHPNEDSYWSASAGGCYDSASSTVAVAILADGMGGYAPGSGLISRDIVRLSGDFLFNHLYAEAQEDSPLQENDVRAVVKSAIQTANEHVLSLIEHSGEMGATLVVAALFGQTAYIANVGDSRAYYVSPAGNVTRITRDQSLVEQQVAAGLLSPDAVYTAFGNNVILHAIGEPQVEQAFDWYLQPLEPGSRVVLCTDGYWKTMGASVWNPDLAARQPTLRLLARAMVEQALNHTDDNTTVLLIGIE